ncbi:hypothetical protein PENSUB_3665 [Penicillium subrubescens]|uniref:Xylanolytic transcriptional activator regulatory domain-containing protein n=1 Tax=Penicillium subrubescens TaxID=1316194 RepID=A0A1Q5UEE5_9EURO|nr:hypothetical protein PENSUB_3665 [Penicillium subrubescens]
MALESCNSEMSWKMLGHALTIAKALGYFSMDENPEGTDVQSSPSQVSTVDETETEKNRKRFEFWHLLRTDCLFRLSFGKPTLIPPGSWKVNFPDPTITGVGDESSRFIQIHFLASMRLALVVMKYLDWVDLGPDPNPVSHDATIDSFLEEQFIPFFILCLDIIGNPEHEDIESDLALVCWVNDHVEKIVDERVELRPVMIIMKAMITACNQVARTV